MIYFDNAATTYKKPEGVYRALSEGTRRLGGNPSRGGHFLSLESSEEVYRCREALADLFDGTAENTVFTLNATHALNIAIKGIAERGDHFIISNMEHNAVLRPMVTLKERLGCSFDIANIIGRSEDEVISEIESLIKESTKAVVMTHASNLVSYKIPVRKIGELCERRGILFILDASQSAGHCNISIKNDRIGILASPGHKGLYGVMGLGFLMTDGRVDLQTLIEGGSGYNSESLYMPEELPEHLEAGTLPLPAIAALRAGIYEVRRIGLSEIEKREAELYRLLHKRLSRIPRVQIYLPEFHGACLLFNIDGISSTQADRRLSEAGICVRSGFHCCPLGHSSLGTGEYGAIRVSFGIFNAEKEVHAFADTVERIAK